MSEQLSAGVDVSDAIRMLRQDLARAMTDGKAADIKFEVNEVVVTLKVALGRSGSAKAGAKFWVIEAGGEATRSKDETQEIVVRLRPVTTDDAGDTHPLHVAAEQTEPGR